MSGYKIEKSKKTDSTARPEEGYYAPDLTGSLNTLRARALCLTVLALKKGVVT